jgi:hypothetical protein
MLTYLTIPGYDSSGPGHWQSHWERQHGYSRVRQSDWLKPLRSTWIPCLEKAIHQAPGPVVLVAHSMGATLVAAWAEQGFSYKVQAAFLVAPADTEAHDSIGVLQNFGPMPAQTLPFPSLLVVSTNDPFMQLERSMYFSEAWGCELVSLDEAGHINTASGHGPWEEGHQMMEKFVVRKTMP